MSPLLAATVMPATTDDHVPPQLLFPTAKPAELVFVPACLRCNSEASFDDEYIRSVFVVEDRAAQHPEARAAYDSFKRSLRIPEKQGFKRGFFASTEPVRIISPEGNVDTGIKTIDMDRISKVLIRVARGLYREAYDRRAPLCCNGLVTSVLNPDQITFDVARDFSRDLERLATHSIGNDGAFRYRFAAASDDPNTSAWWFEFYRALPFIVLLIDPHD